MSALFLVTFQEKFAHGFEPESYFHPAALERRRQEGLPMADEKDWPVHPAYVEATAARVEQLRYQLRWFNGVSVKATGAQIEAVARLPFVKEIIALGGSSQIAALPNHFSVSASDSFFQQVSNQLHLQALSQRNLSGSGQRIAIFDAGFKTVDTHPAFERLRGRKGIVATRDFYQGDEMVYRHSDHGALVLSVMAGYYQDQPMGAATGADYLLARTEHVKKEQPAEEDHWLAAAEWADQQGADIINTSITFFLGYTYPEMDGRSLAVSKAAKIASDKGILVISAMGNEGDKRWKYLASPADVPEVVSVGGSMPNLPLPTSFTAFGPNARGERKPDVAAPALVWGTHKKDQYSEQAGTSFSAPLVAGMAACLMQAFPRMKRGEIAEMLRQAGHFYPYFDYRLGYGVVDARRFFNPGAGRTDYNFQVQYRSDTVLVVFNPEVMLDSAAFPYGRYLYFQMGDQEGRIQLAEVTRLQHRTQAYFFMRNPKSEGILRIWFEGQLYEQEVSRLE
ncbi:MAG: S8 family serine peptidase [Bacteroidota bacterium]